MRKYLFLFLLPSLLFAKEAKVKATVILQKSDGFPGEKKEKKPLVLQKVYLYKDRLAIVDQESPFRTRIVRLDKRLVWELVPEKKIYVETSFSKFEEIRKKRERDRKRLWKAIVESNLPEKVKKARLKAEGLSEDGEDHFTTEFTGRTRPYLGNFLCREWVAKRNGKPILIAWVSDKISKPKHLLDFYEKLGLFTEKEIQVFRKIPAFPLAFTLWVDLGMKGTYRISTYILSMKKEEVSLSLFDLPKGYKKYTPPKPALRCPVCGKKVESKRYRVAWKGKIYYCCSKKHQVRWLVYCVRKKK